MEPDLSIALKLLEVMPQRYLSPNADDLTDGDLLADDVTTIVEAMWPMKTGPSESREALEQARREYEEAVAAEAFESAAPQYGRPSDKPDAVRAAGLRDGDVLEALEPFSDLVAGERGTVVRVLRGAVKVDFGRGALVHCSDGDYLDRVKLVHPVLEDAEKLFEENPPELCCGGDSKACAVNGPCSIERQRRNEPELYLTVGDASKGRDAWFHTPEHQKKEQEAQDDIDAGRVKEVPEEGFRPVKPGDTLRILVDNPSAADLLAGDVVMVKSVLGRMLETTREYFLPLVDEGHTWVRDSSGALRRTVLLVDGPVSTLETARAEIVVDLRDLKVIKARHANPAVFNVRDLRRAGPFR